MTSVSGFAAPLNAVSSAQASQSSAVASATSHGQRPSFSMDAVSAIQVTNALSQRLNHLNQIRALERADGLVNVTLAAVEAIEDTLMEMRTLSARLQDESLSEDHRAKLIHEYGALIPRVNQITEMATFGGRNLINPQATSQSGDVILPGGMKLGATDLRMDQARTLSVGPLSSSLQYTMAFEGNIQAQAYGAPPITAGTAGYPPVYVEGEYGGIASGGNGRIDYMLSGDNAANDAITVSMSLKKGAHGLNNAFQFTTEDDDIVVRFHHTRLFIFNGGSQITSIEVATDDFFRFAMAIDESGSVSMYKNGDIFVNFTLSSSIGESNKLIRIEGNGIHDNMSIHSVSLSQNEIRQVDRWAAIGVQNWTNWEEADRWDLATADLGQSLQKLLAVQSELGSASRSIAAKMSMQQRMADIIDAGASRLVNRDIERVGALEVAAQVRTQLAQAMMQTQTGIMNAQIGLLSNSLALFDSINIGGFTPGRLSL